MQLETKRLQIRTFTPDDTPAIHRILDLCFGDGTQGGSPEAMAERQSWVEWCILNQQWHANLHQPPYGEQALVLKESGVLIGAVGYVPSFDMFEQLPDLRCPGTPGSSYSTPEFGLFWAVGPDYQGHGYATEAGHALIAHAFSQLHLKRIVATTEHDNLASQGVMRKLGMQVAHNPLSTPPWLQVVGVLHNGG